jgi:ABC-type nitrate/sulfonate/bicarbonate transport system permease component
MNRKLLLRLAGTCVVLLVWQIGGMTGVLGPAIAPPTQVIAGVISDGTAFYGLHVPVTLTSAAVGYLSGNLVAIACAASVVVIPWLEKLVLQIGIASACVPLIAIAPILAACFNGPLTSTVLAAVSVFFTTLVGSVNGLRQADRSSEDLVRAYGGGRYAVLRKVQLLSALPSILNAMKIAVPLAMLGTVIGESMGQERGLGSALMVAQQASNIVRTWGIALVLSLLTACGFLAIGAVERIATPWAAGMSKETA